MSNEALMNEGLKAAGVDAQTAGALSKTTESVRKQKGVSDEDAAAIGGVAGVAAGASLQAIGIPAPIGMAVGAAVGKELGPIIKDGVNYLFGGESAAEKRRREAEATTRSIDRTNKMLEYMSAVTAQSYNHTEAMVAFLTKQKIGTTKLVETEQQARNIVKAVDAQIPLLQPVKMLWWFNGSKFDLNVFKNDPLALTRLNQIAEANKKIMKRQWAAVADVVTMLRARKLAQFMMALRGWAEQMRRAEAERKSAAERERLAEEAARKLKEELEARERRKRSLQLGLLAVGVGGYVWYRRRKKAA